MGNYPPSSDEAASGLSSAAIGQIVQLTDSRHEHKSFPLLDGGNGVLVPPGYKLEKLYNPDQLSIFITAAPVFNEAESFIRYVNTYKAGGPATQIFASINDSKLTAILDYHKPSEPSSLRHTAVLKLRHSPEWERWTSFAERWQTQVNFAEFVEENLLYILEPEGAKLLEMVTNFTENRTVTFASKVNIRNGSIAMTYNDEDAGKETGQVSIPQKLTLALAVYDGEAKEQVSALVRTRVERGTLHLMIKLDQITELRRAAFKRINAAVGAATSIDVLQGTPSSH